MGYTEAEGDLFRQDLPALGHGCNCQGSMGAGIAVEFRRRYPAMYAEYRQRCRAGLFQLGDVFPWDAGSVVIYNLATQPRPGPTASLEAIADAVAKMLLDAEQRGISKVGVPRLGAGLGGLRWQAVADVLRTQAEASSTMLIAYSLSAQSRTASE